MSKILETLRHFEHAARPVGSIGHTQLDIFEPWLIDDFDHHDRTIIQGIRDGLPGETVISFKDAKDMLPTLFANRDIMEPLIATAGQIREPERIRSVGLQLGAYAIHTLHLLQWSDMETAYVSYIPRGAATSPFGIQAITDINVLPVLSQVMHRQRPEVRKHTDVINIVSSGSIQWNAMDIPVYITKFDDSRIEIGIKPTHVILGNNMDKRVVPVPDMAVAMTQQTVRDAKLQEYIGEELRGDRKNGALRIIVTQLSRIAESHAVLAHATWHIPAGMRIQAGDWMGQFDHLSKDSEDARAQLIGRMRLMTVKGGVTQASNINEWITAMRKYSYRWNEQLYPLFDLLSDSDLVSAWYRAKLLVK